MAEAAAGPVVNPYVGPRAFDQADRDLFFGREREIRQLLALAVAWRVVLLYAPSGAGKTSLLQAGLLPRLRELKEVTVLPVVRVGGPPPAGPGGEGLNVYSASLLADLRGGEGAVPGPDHDLAQGIGRLLDREPEGERSRPHFLVLDQLEELFTAHAERWAERVPFLVELAAMLSAYPQITLLLAMREDYVGQLDPHRGLLPDRLRTRFRLELLGPEAARLAITAPARAAGVAVRAAAADRLVDELRALRVQAADGSTREGLGPFVDPVHLQVVCRRLWERRSAGAAGPAGSTELGEELLAEAGGVDQALARYYADQVAAAASVGEEPEHAVRDWVDRHLLTAQGLRGQVLRAPERTGGLDNRAVAALVAAHLVRAEERRGAVWFELAHDRLLAPVRADNAAWREENLSTLQRQAALWERAARPEGLLLAGRALAAAEAWAAERDGSGASLGPAERDFLAACRRERRRGRQLRLWAIAATLFLLLAVGALLRARAERGRALLAGLAARAMAEIPERLDLALLLALESDRRGDPEALPLLVRALESSPHMEAVLGGAGADVLDLAWSPDGRRLVSAGEDGAVWLWDAVARRPAGPPLAHLDGRAWSVDWSADGRRLAAGGEGGSVLVWDLAAGRGRPRRPRAVLLPLPLALPNAEAVYALRFSPDGGTLAAATYDHVLRFDAASGRLLGPALGGPRDLLTSLAWSADGHLLAAAGNDKKIWLWDAATGEPRGPPLSGHAETVTGLAFAPTGRVLASSSLDGTLTLWDAAAGRRLGAPLNPFAGDLWGVTFSPDGRFLAAGGESRILLWDARTLRLVDPPFAGRAGTDRRLAFRPDGRALASGCDGALVLWSVRPGPRLAARGQRLHPSAPSLHSSRGAATAGIRALLPGFAEPVTAWAASADGRLLATAGRNRRLRLWDAATGRLLAGPLAGHRYEVDGLAFAGGGRTLLSTAIDGTLLAWDADPASWRRRACRVANRDLTPEERRRYLGAASGPPLCPPRRR